MGHMDPTACKVMQLWLRCRLPRTHTPTPKEASRRGKPPLLRTDLTPEPSCKDEARIGQQGTLTRVWAERGSRPAAPRDQRSD